MVQLSTAHETSHGTLQIDAADITTQHLIVVIQYSPEAGIEYTTEQVVEDLLHLNQQVILSMRDGLRGELYTVVMPLTAKVTVTL